MMKRTPPRSPLPRIDARKPELREIAKHLREQHLAGVDTDDDASVALEIEQARLTLFASAGVIAFEVTQLLSATRDVCVTPLYYSMALLCLGLCGAWIALLWSEHIRRFRVDRRYRVYHGDLEQYLTTPADIAIGHYPVNTAWSGQITKEGSKRLWLRVFRYFVALIVAAGIAAGVLAAVGTADPRRCVGELLKTQPAAKRHT